MDTELNNEWRDVTNEYKEKVGVFLENYLEQENSFEEDNDNTKHYDSLSELHISGHVLVDEASSITRIDAFYNNGKIIKMHILYAREKHSNADVYISGQALEDLLS